MAAELHSPRDTTWLKKWHRSVWFCKNKSMSGSQWWMNEHSKQQLNSFCNCACSYPNFRPCLSCPPKESPTHPAADIVAQLLFITPLLRMASEALAAGSDSSEFLSAFWSLSSASLESSFVSFWVRGAVASACRSVPCLSFGCSSVGLCLLKIVIDLSEGRFSFPPYILQAICVLVWCCTQGREYFCPIFLVVSYSISTAYDLSFFHLGKKVTLESKCVINRTCSPPPYHTCFALSTVFWYVLKYSL